MTDIPLPEPIFGFLRPSQSDGRWTEAESGEPAFDANQMHTHAAAVSADDNAALRAKLAKHQESEFHPDWSLLASTRDSLAEHQQMVRDLVERVRVLEDALRMTIVQNEHDMLLTGEELRTARAALGGKK